MTFDGARRRLLAQFLLSEKHLFYPLDEVIAAKDALAEYCSLHIYPCGNVGDELFPVSVSSFRVVAAIVAQNKRVVDHFFPPALIEIAGKAAPRIAEKFVELFLPRALH